MVAASFMNIKQLDERGVFRRANCRLFEDFIETKFGPPPSHALFTLLIALELLYIVSTKYLYCFSSQISVEKIICIG